MKITIVTPSFNQGKWISQTIESVWSQDGDFQIEHIIVDGGSTDETVEIIKKYENALSTWPIKCNGIIFNWVSEKDKGQMDAIEKGFAQATGDIGTWLNSDDTFLPGALQTIVDEFSDDGTLELVIGNGIVFNQENRILFNYEVERINFKELLLLDYHILQNASFLKIKFLKNSQFDHTLNYSFDVDYFARLIKEGIKFKKISNHLAGLRMYPETKTSSGGPALVKEYISIAKKHFKNPFLIGYSRVYKYITTVLNPHANRFLFYRFLYNEFHKCSYRIIIGTWGR